MKSLVLSKPLPPRSLCQIGESLYVCSPEITFLEMGRRLSQLDLILYGFELCGSYAMNPQVEEGFVKRCALTSVARLSAFARDASFAPGSKPARAVLRHVVEGSASPMETAVTLLLCLPVRLGGYGIDRPLLNAPVPVCPSSPFESGVRYCDLLWKGARFALEYDSRTYHSSEEKQKADSRRRAELNDAGIAVVSVTAEQVYNAEEFERIARIVARATGRAIDSRAFRDSKKRHDLRKKLLRL